MSRKIVHIYKSTKSRNWVTVVLTVEAGPSANVGLGDFARIVLHPTFSPPAIKVAFRGRHARLRIRAWGGFTVGAWVPRDGIELELDLAQVESAPRIIRDRYSERH